MNYMMFISLIIIVALSPGFAFADISQEEKDASYEAAQNFAQCAALFDTMADEADLAGEEDLATSFRNQSNGSEVTSHYFGKNAEIKDPKMFYESIYGAVISSYKVSLKNEGVEGPKIKNIMQLCASLSPLQAKVIQQLRKKAYTE